MKTLLGFVKIVFVGSAEIVEHCTAVSKAKLPELIASAAEIHTAFLSAVEETGIAEPLGRLVTAVEADTETGGEMAHQIVCALLGKKPESHEMRRLRKEIAEWIDCERPHLDEEVADLVAKYGALSLKRSGLDLTGMSDADIEEVAEDFVEALPPNTEIRDAHYDGRLCDALMRALERMQMRGELKVEKLALTTVTGE